MLPSEFTPLTISPASTDVEEGDEEERAAPFTSSAPDVAMIGGGVSPDRSLLRRSPGGGRSGSSRRVSSDPSIYSTQRRSMSFRGDVTHAVSEMYLVTRLALTLLRYLGIGYRWIIKFLALACYTLLLLPGFLQVGYYYFFSSEVRRSIVYGEQPRNRLDLYLPVCADGSRPIVAFVTGGAWIIGYKAWGALLGRRLAERGIIVACIDYRNFPQGTISHMVEDASRGISFVCKNAVSFGGDPNRIYLIGQSAGAHIAACALIEQAIKECGEGESTSWSLSQIKAYFGISGGYNLLDLVNHFHRRGLYRSIFLSKEFADSLHQVGAKADLVLCEGKTHTDLFLQDPLRGGKDELLDDIVSRIHDTSASDDHDAAAHLPRRLVPECMLQLARKISPF